MYLRMHVYMIVYAYVYTAIYIYMCSKFNGALSMEGVMLRNFDRIRGSAFYEFWIGFLRR